MAITRKDKEQSVQEISDIFNNAESAVFVHFRGLPVKEELALRLAMRKEGMQYKVVRKTLLRRAVNSVSKITGEFPHLDGEVAIAYGNDPLAPARIAYEFQQTHKKTFALLGGIFENVLRNQAEMTEIATIPPLQILRGMLVNIINSPIQRFAIALNEVAKTKA